MGFWLVPLRVFDVGTIFRRWSRNGVHRGDASGASRSHELIVTLRLKETDSLLPLKHSLSLDIAMVKCFWVKSTRLVRPFIRSITHVIANILIENDELKINECIWNYSIGM